MSEENRDASKDENCVFPDLDVIAEWNALQRQQHVSIAFADICLAKLCQSDMDDDINAQRGDFGYQDQYTGADFEDPWSRYGTDRSIGYQQTDEDPFQTLDDEHNAAGPDVSLSNEWSRLPRPQQSDRQEGSVHFEQQQPRQQVDRPAQTDIAAPSAAASASASTSARRHHCLMQGCSSAFKYPKDLRRHQTTHEENPDRSFKCPFERCEYATEGFLRKDALTRHVKAKH